MAVHFYSFLIFKFSRIKVSKCEGGFILKAVFRVRGVANGSDSTQAVDVDVSRLCCRINKENKYSQDPSGDLVYDIYVKARVLQARFN